MEKKEIDFEYMFYESSEKIIFMLVPISTDYKKIYEELIKFIPNFRSNSYLVTLEESENSNIIGYDDMERKIDTNDQKIIFVIDDLKVFSYYNINLLKNNKNNNFIIMLDINSIPLFRNNIAPQLKNETLVLFPKNFDLPVEYNYYKRISYIFGNQLKEYKKLYLDYKKSNIDVYKDDNESISKDKIFDVLNVFYDKAMTSLENQTLENVFQRTPKFKTIFIDILIKNKNRHFVKMQDGRHGINAFEVIYNKLNDTMPLVIIRAADEFNIKMKKLKSFNSTNGPMILLSDYSFSKDIIPMNIDYYHLTNGGTKEDFYSMLDMGKTNNYSGIYPRDINIINHVASSSNDLTFNDEEANNFYNYFTSLFDFYNNFKENVSLKLYLKGDKFYFSK